MTKPSAIQVLLAKRLGLPATASKTEVCRAALRKMATFGVIDSSAPACIHSVRAGNGYERCGGTRAEYSVGGGQATRKCLKCGDTTRIDVSPDVPKKIKTADDWRDWWRKAYGF